MQSAYLVLVLLMSLFGRACTLLISARPRHTLRIVRAGGAFPSLAQAHQVHVSATYSSNSQTRMSAGGGGDVEPVSPEDDESLKGKVKKLWKQYGVVAIGTYLGIYVSVLSSVYFALEYDVFNASTFGFDPTSAVQKVCDLVENFTGSTFLPGYIREHPRVGTFAVAWVMTKFTEPLRLALAISVVPGVARTLGRAPPKVKVP